MKQPDLGKRIAELRKKKGLTQDELVDRCNINVRTIQRIESGEVTPRTSTLRIIFDALQENFHTIEEEENRTISINPFTDNGRKNLFQMKRTTPRSVMARQLQLAWILAIVSFMLYFVVMAFEYQHVLPWNFNRALFFYPVFKILALLTYLYWQRGIAVLGTVYKNHLLKITSYILIGFALFNDFYNLIGYYHPEIKISALNSAISITIGAILIIYAWGLWRLKKHLGTIAIFGGICSFISGFFFITLIFWWIGLIITLLLDLSEMILLYKGYDQMQDEMNKSVEQ